MPATMIRRCFEDACAHSSRAPKTAGILEVCEQLMYLQHTNQRFSEIMSSDLLASRIAGGDHEMLWFILFLFTLDLDFPRAFMIML